MYYWYGMRLRGCSIGAQPKGFVRFRDCNRNEEYWSVVAYDHELSEKECEDYDLDYLGKADLW